LELPDPAFAARRADARAHALARQCVGDVERPLVQIGDAVAARAQALDRGLDDGSVRRTGAMVGAASHAATLPPRAGAGGRKISCRERRRGTGRPGPAGRRTDPTGSTTA